jgi:hypothetical protein
LNIGWTTVIRQVRPVKARERQTSNRHPTLLSVWFIWGCSQVGFHELSLLAQLVIVGIDHADKTFGTGFANQLDLTPTSSHCSARRTQ